MRKIFNTNDLRKCDWQYTVRHLDVNCFSINEKVFLKSNPETPLNVVTINEDTVTVSLPSKNNIIETITLSPQSILQYKYAGLKTYQDRYFISLN